MKTGRKVGIGVFIVGVLFIVVNLVSIQVSNYYFPKIFLTGISSCFIGLGFIFFPGGDVTVDSRKKFFKDLWKNSSVLDKIMWILFSLAGILVAIWTIVYYNLNLT